MRLPTLVAVLAASGGLAEQSFAQGTSELFDASAYTYLGNDTRMERLADIDGDGVLEAVGWWLYQHPNGSTSGHARMDVVSFDQTTGHHTFHRSQTGFLADINGHDRTEVADLDGDGDDEIVVVRRITSGSHPAGTSRLRLEAYEFDAGFQARHPRWVYEPGLNTTSEVASVVADFDLDGRDDIVVYDGAVLAFYRSIATDLRNSNLPTWTRVDEIPAYGGRMELRANDLNGDGVPELLALQDHGHPLVWVHPMSLAGVGAGTRYILEATTAGEIISLASGDIDLDGDEDIVAFGHDGEYQVVRNDASALAVEARNIGGPATELADIDGDGDLDGICCGGGSTTVWVHNTNPSTFHLCTNDGTGGFDVSVGFPGLGARRVAGVLDFDRDGDMDVIAGRAVLMGTSAMGEIYCPAAPNSSTGAARLVALGNHSAAEGGAQLYGSALPPQTTCLLVASPVTSAASVVPTAFWNGRLCISSAGISRLRVATSDVAGTVHLGATPDWLTSTMPLGTVAGELYGYQLWFRDVAGGGTGADLSNAIRLLVTP